MANIVLDKSYTESANTPDALKSSYSFGKSKDVSNSSFSNILSGLTSDNLDSPKTKSEVNKQNVQTANSAEKTSETVSKNAHLTANNQSKQNTKQVKNSVENQDTSASSKGTNSSEKTTSKDSKSVEQSSDNNEQIEKNDKSASNSSTDTQTTTSSNDDISTDMQQVEVDVALATDISALTEDAASSAVSDGETPVDIKVQTAKPKDDVKIDLNTINTFNLQNISDKELKDDDINTDEQEDSETTDTDDVNIKVSTETVDADKLQNKTSKTDVKHDTEITNEMLNDLDAKVTGLSTQAENSESGDASDGQNALDQAIILSIEGTSDTSETQDFSKLLNVDMLKQVEAKANVDVASTAQAAKPATNVDILNQISDKLAEMRNGTADKIEIALKPANLGKVNVEISSAKGVLTATLVAENEEVKNVLNKNIDSLKNTLASHGVNLNSVNVKISDAEKSAMNNNFDFSKDQFMNDSQDHGKNERAQESYNSANSNISSSEENSEEEGDIVLTSTNRNESSYHNGMVDYKI